MKKIISVLLIIVMALSLFACSKISADKTRTEDILNGEKVVGKQYYKDDVLEKEEYFEDENGTSRVLEYDEKGAVLETVSINGEKTSATKKSAEGEVIYTMTYEENGQIKTSYENGNVSKSESFDKEGNLTGYTDMKYDENGRSSGSETYSKEGNLVLKSVYEYEGDSMSKIYMYNPDGSLFQTGVYDENGHLTLYDAQGNVVG